MSSVQTAEREHSGQTHKVTQAEIDAMSNAELLAAYKETGDEQYKWPLVMRYEGVIKNVALQIRGVYSSFAQVEDIISEGILTLLNAVDKFDPDKGIKFETYISKTSPSRSPRIVFASRWPERIMRKTNPSGVSIASDFTRPAFPRVKFALAFRSISIQVPTIQT